MIIFIQVYEVAQIQSRARKKKGSAFYSLPKKVVTQRERAPWPKNEKKNLSERISGKFQIVTKYLWFVFIPVEIT